MKYIFKPKQCNQCKEAYIPNSGSHIYCKKCALKRNKVSSNKAGRKYRQGHRDKVRLWKRKWWHRLTSEQKQVVTDKRMKIYWENPILAREKSRKIYKNWVSTEKGKLLHRMANYKRRTKEKLVFHNFTYDEWRQKLNSVRGVCQICHRRVGREKLTLDHIKPLSKVPEGFIYGINSIQPVCEGCNKSKRDKEVKNE